MRLKGKCKEFLKEYLTDIYSILRLILKYLFTIYSLMSIKMKGIKRDEFRKRHQNHHEFIWIFVTHIYLWTDYFIFVLGLTIGQTELTMTVNTVYSDNKLLSNDLEEGKEMENVGGSSGVDPHRYKRREMSWKMRV